MEKLSLRNKLVIGTAIAVVGGVVGTPLALKCGMDQLAEEQARIEEERTRTCRALSKTIEGMNPDETALQQLCTNDLIKDCLTETGLCK